MNSTVQSLTGEVVITRWDVRRSVATAKAHLEKAAEQIVWQIENRAWEVLGYPDWDTMREAEYGGAAFMVPRAERPELVARMRRSGLTQQEIANTAGVAKATVQNDLKANSGFEPETVTNSRGQERPATYNRPAPAPSKPTLEELASTAVEEFPDLAYYAELGQLRNVALMAEDMRRFRDRGELDERLDNLRRAIALDRAKRDGTYQEGTTATLGDDGEYRMTPMPTASTTTTPTCRLCGQAIPKG